MTLEIATEYGQAVRQGLHLRHLENILHAVATRAPTVDWLNGSTRAAFGYQAFEQYVRENPAAQIYGFNTLCGHRDDHQLDEMAARRFQGNIIDTHAISSVESYLPDAAIAIFATKIQQTSFGRATISSDLYDVMLRAFSDPLFIPDIPMRSSYSCGDVIPGAHFANSLRRYCRDRGEPLQLARGEGMALINGSFVHLGYAASVAPALAALWRHFLDAQRSTLAITQADGSAISFALADATDTAPALEYLLEVAQSVPDRPQWPVSFRAIPEAVQMLHEALSDFLMEIERQLGRPSNNPLLGEGSNGLRPYSQASFMLPSLSARTSQLLEAISFVAWAEVTKIKWLMSGHVAGIPVDGQVHDEDVAFIQWPKMMQAMLEELRLITGRSAFSSGSDTSYGVEDLWTSGVMNTDRLVSATRITSEIMTMGLRLKARLSSRFGLDIGLPQDVAETLATESQLVAGEYHRFHPGTDATALF